MKQVVMGKQSNYNTRNTWAWDRTSELYTQNM